MERCLQKLVLEAETTGFQDPARTARSPQSEELCWKGSVEGRWLYTHEFIIENADYLRSQKRLDLLYVGVRVTEIAKWSS